MPVERNSKTKKSTTSRRGPKPGLRLEERGEAKKSKMWKESKPLPPPQSKPEREVVEPETSLEDLVVEETQIDEKLNEFLDEVERENARKKYPSPRRDPSFTARWHQFLPSIINRPNFRPNILYQLAVLCDLYVQYDRLRAFINLKGYTYESRGRNGLLIKNRPEVDLLQRTMSEIRNYSKILGILLVKDDGKPVGGKKDTWD